MTSTALQQINYCQRATERLVNRLENSVSQSDGNDANTFWELEVRFGQITDAGFCPGTTYNFFMNVLHWFETCTEWVNVEDWTEIHEFYYRVDRRIVRTTVTFGGGSVQTEHKWKQKHDKHNFFCRRDRIPASHANPNFWPDFRIELSSEEAVTGQLPEVIDTALVRIKQRKSFFYKMPTDTGDATPLWRYDFTRCWSGKTMAEAEQNQRSSSTVEPRYEIELECCNPLAVLKEYGMERMVKSLLLKTNDFYMPSVWETVSVHRNLQGIDYYLDAE